MPRGYFLTLYRLFVIFIAFITYHFISQFGILTLRPLILSFIFRQKKFHIFLIGLWRERKNFFEQLEMRQKAAERISTDLFDIDLHIFAQTTNNLESSFSIEKNYELISSSSSGSKSEMKKFEKFGIIFK